MNKEDIKNYFDLHVLNYQPYRDIPEYQAIVKTLIDFYFDHSYNSINLPFKTAFEAQTIPVEFYNNLLLSIGFPKYIISNLTNKDKKILLHSFMDYNRYKGTIEQLRLVGTKFSEDVGIYELFIDLREIEINYYYMYTYDNTDYFDLESVKLYDKLELNDIFTIAGVEYSINDKVLTSDGIYRIYIDRLYIGENLSIRNFKIKRWVFLPEAIFTAIGMNPPPEYFNYVSVYRDTKRYFVSPEYLTAHYRSDSLVLPIKSNLLFLDYKKYREINTFYNLLAAIFLKQFYNERVIIYFNEGAYSTTLGKLYRLWYYILMKFYKYDFVDDSPINIVSLNITNPNFTYTIDDIPTLLKEYKKVTEYDPIEKNNISTSEYSKYYFKTVSSKLISDFKTNVNLTLDEYKVILENEVSLSLISYIDNRIETCGSELKDYEYTLILDEIYASLITWSIQSDNPKILDNVNYFIKNLSFISYPIAMSPTYNLIMFLKPYHVELITELNEYLKIRDIANSAIPDSSFVKIGVISFLRASALALSEQIAHTVVYNNITSINADEMGADSLTVTHGRIYNIRHLVNTLNQIDTDLYKMTVEYIEEIIAQPNAIHVLFNIYPVLKDLVFTISNYQIDIVKTNMTLLNIINSVHQFIHILNPNDKLISDHVVTTSTSITDLDSSAYVNSDMNSGIVYSTVQNPEIPIYVPDIDQSQLIDDKYYPRNITPGTESYYNEITTCDIVHTYNLI